MTDQHGMLTEDGRIIFYVHHLNEANRQKVSNVKAVYEENEKLKERIEKLEGCVFAGELAHKSLLEHGKLLLARIAELEAERTWQPIETAPREPIGVMPVGPRLLLFHPKYGAGSGHFGRRWHLHFCLDKEAQPTHWMPMPKMEDK